MITREEMIMWLSNPITKGLFEIFKAERTAAEDRAFNSTLSAFHNKDIFLSQRTQPELLSFAYLEVANHILSATFVPLYDDLKEIDKNKENADEEKDDSISTFTNKINEVLKHEK